MDSVNYNDFKNICRICLLTCEHKLLLDFVVSKIYYMLSGFHVERNDELPQQICQNCFTKILEINSFALKCKDAHSILMKCLNEYKIEGLKKEPDIIDGTNEVVKIKDLKEDANIFVKSEVTIEEHKLEFVNVNEFDFTNDQLKIKTENPESDENIENDETSDDNTNQNDSISGSADITSIKQVSNQIIEQPFKCDLCPKSYKLKRILNVHRKKHFAWCEICNKIFQSISDLTTHKLIHGGERPFVCEICKTTFTRIYNLNKHKRIHSGKRPHVCKICNKSFVQSGDLSKHKRIHSDVRPYVCDICTKTFKYSADLNKHKRIHSGERPYICKVCSKTFNHSSHLNVHMRTHSGERPFACDICSKTFSHSSNLYIHKRIHSGERPHKCDVCSKSFTQLSGLNTHKCIQSGVS